MDILIQPTIFMLGLDNQKLMEICQPKVIELWPQNVTACCVSPHFNWIFSQESGNHGVPVSQAYYKHFQGKRLLMFMVQDVCRLYHILNLLCKSFISRQSFSMIIFKFLFSQKWQFFHDWDFIDTYSCHHFSFYCRSSFKCSLLYGINILTCIWTYCHIATQYTELLK